MKPGQCACRRSLQHSYFHLLMGLGLTHFCADLLCSVVSWRLPLRYIAMPWREWRRRLADPDPTIAAYWHERRPGTRAWLWFTFWPS